MKLSSKLKGDFIKIKVVIGGFNNYEKLKNSSNLLKLIVQPENDIENSNTIEQDMMFDNLEKKLFS